MPRDTWGTPGRILAVRLDNVGDVLLLGPALRALKARFPASALTLLASPAGSQAAALLPWVDDLVPWRASWQDASSSLPLDPAREQELVAALRARRFDAAFIFTSFSQSVWPPAYACYLAGIPVRVGQARDFGGSLLSDCVKPPADCTHQSERNLHLLEACGIPVGARDLEVCLPTGARRAADDLLRGLGLAQSPFIIAAPGASCAARRYDKARYAAALSMLGRRVGLPIILAGHAREAVLLREIKAASRSRHVLVPPRDTTLPELAALIRRARLLVANNSGPMHLADALRCPTVVLYSGSDLEEQWRPRTALSRLLRRPTPCEPCYRFECPYRMECLDIPPREVADACEELLDRTARRAAPACDVVAGDATRDCPAEGTA